MEKSEFSGEHSERSTTGALEEACETINTLQQDESVDQVDKSDDEFEIIDESTIDPADRSTKRIVADKISKLDQAICEKLLDCNHPSQEQICGKVKEFSEEERNASALDLAGQDGGMAAGISRKALVASKAVEGPEDSDEVNLDGLTEEEKVIVELVRLRSELQEWADNREKTIEKLRDIADYIESVSRRTGFVKIVGSGGGALAGGLAIIGGALTVATAGAAAVPILLAGTGLGLTAGITGGAAAITEKIIQSRQMSEAQEAIDKDKDATAHLETSMVRLQNNKLARQAAAAAVLSGGSAVADSIKFYGMLAHQGASGLGQVGAETLGRIFGEDVGKEVSKLILYTSGRVVTGTFTIMLGGASMIYDIYRLSGEVRNMAKQGQAGDLRTIADQLEQALRELCQKNEEDNSIPSDEAMSSAT